MEYIILIFIYLISATSIVAIVTNSEEYETEILFTKFGLSTLIIPIWNTAFLVGLIVSLYITNKRFRP